MTVVRSGSWGDAVDNAFAFVTDYDSAFDARPVMHNPNRTPSWSRCTVLAGMLWMFACGHHATGSGGASGTGAAGEGVSKVADGGAPGSQAGGGPSGTGGGFAGMMALTCSEPPSSAPIQCGGQTCDPPTPSQLNPCVVLCCTSFDGRDRCGVRSTARGLSSECELPAIFDPSCDEVVQFPGCCDLKQHKCGIMAGLRPSCVTTSSFVTLPASPKSCGLDDDAGVDRDGG
jgi:hypothetical protein